MAILKGLIRRMSGSAGDFTFSQIQGRTIVSEKITATTDRKTSAQQRVRMKWGNIIQMYKGIMPLLQNGFENKPVGVSDYNMFVKVNMQHAPVYLTKSEVAGGACIVAPYTITQGSLPAIVVTAVSGKDKTDIRLGSLTIDATTTVAQFANAVVQNNTDYNYGDQISFYDVKQLVNAATGLPYGVFKACRVVLDKSDSSLLLSRVIADAFSAVDGCLGHEIPTGNRAYCWVHSRKSGGKTKVSSQTLIDHNAILANYSDENAYQGAANSYGGENKVFLTPDGKYEISYESGDDSGDEGDPSTGSGTNQGEEQGNTPAAKKTVALSVSPSGAGTVTGGGQYDAGASATLKAVAASGFHFVKWSDNNTSATRTVTVNADLTLQAIFAADAPQGGGDEGGGSGSGTGGGSEEEDPYNYGD